MTRDFYGDARVVAVHLADAGLNEWATKLDDVLEGGATSTEILMGIRWNLRQLLAAGPDNLRPELRDSAAEIANAIDGVLG